MMIYALLIFVGGLVQPLGWFHTQKECVDAAWEIASEIGVSADAPDDVWCVAYEVVEEKRS